VRIQKRNRAAPTRFRSLCGGVVSIQRRERGRSRAVERSLSEVYQRDNKRILRRARLVMSVPSLVAASAADAGAFRAELSSVLLAARRTGK
jgi:hypothetical protein